MYLFIIYSFSMENLQGKHLNFLCKNCIIPKTALFFFKCKLFYFISSCRKMRDQVGSSFKHHVSPEQHLADDSGFHLFTSVS